MAAMAPSTAKTKVPSKSIVKSSLAESYLMGSSRSYYFLRGSGIFNSATTKDTKVHKETLLLHDEGNHGASRRVA